MSLATAVLAYSPSLASGPMLAWGGSTAPSFLNAKLVITENSNLIELNTRLKKNDLIENIYVQEFNNESIFLKIKYLGKLDKIIRQLKEKKIILKLIEDQWSIKII